MGLVRFFISNASLSLLRICDQGSHSGNSGECPAQASNRHLTAGLTLTDDETTQILSAAVAYNRDPSFTWFAPGQLTTFSAMMSTLAPGMFMELRDLAPPPAAEGVVLGRE